MKKNSEKTVAEVLVEGLEVSNTETTSAVDFTSREYLESNEPTFDADFASKKYDADWRSGSINI